MSLNNLIITKPWFGVLCKTYFTGADSLTASPLGEVPSRRAAEVGSIEADEAGKKACGARPRFDRRGSTLACAGSIGSAEGSHEVTGDQGGLFFASFLLATQKK
ncbi:MAG: hypothetical protein KBC57_12895 [Neisseriaceae bacterium]|nr:hypothetical protein [Neisseriaceae bacterium]